ncbi:hypothetical protein [Rhodobacter sp. 24-YEA-8]|uniref:hypothetical protein n=1 Tax=Rhodobacter sp. 24-YEA-8 TaxID=1884310 RepID=UPI0008951761|nr:hypothetical protein [Rhodobacter sp. 24-YEA-8]SED49801.1 hypothetical protein SAMN05519105_4129 [Rhodobacter sp. 24-YEA-8]
MPVKTRNKGVLSRREAKPSIDDDETYPADMEDARSEPDDMGEAKPGPRNPKPIPTPED